MTKRDMVNRIAKLTGYPKTHIDRVIDLFQDLVVEALATEGRLELRDFASWRTVTLPARVGRNPATGEPVTIPESKHVRMRAGKHMRERINE